KVLENMINYIVKEFLNLGFDKAYIENKFYDQLLVIKKKDLEVINDGLTLYKIKIAPLIYEIFLEEVVDYLVESNSINIMVNLKSKGFLPIEFIVELRDLKTLLEQNPDKKANLKKYIQIREKVIEKFVDNKKEIESLEDLKNPRDKLQLMYLIYRIIDFFHLQKLFNFSKIKEYLKNNIDEWLDTIPLITLKNPDLYFCGIYLSKHLGVEIDKKKVETFLKNLKDETLDEFEAPVIEATDRIYYYFKATMLTKLKLPKEQIKRFIKFNAKFYEPQYLRTLETSQLVVILKIFNVLGISQMIDLQKIKRIVEEIDQRITPEGIKQYRDGFISSEATYYVLFCNYMKNSLKKLQDYDLLSNIVSRIYRNLEILYFSSDMNHDLVSEIFYSCESLKLLNCIETKEMIVHLAKYLFPQEIVKKIIKSEHITRSTTRFRHLKVNRITGETIY
ncbi:MAG: hypothetical protein ACTSQJ_14165, partial [Promethearchaeota archaeon]